MISALNQAPVSSLIVSTLSPTLSNKINILIDLIKKKKKSTFGIVSFLKRYLEEVSFGHILLSTLPWSRSAGEDLIWECALK